MTTNAADQHQRPTKRNSASCDAGRSSASRRTDNNGRAAARPTLGSQTGTVNVSAWAFAPGTTATDAQANVPTANGTANTANTNTSTTQPIGLANYQISLLQQSDGSTQFVGTLLDHTGSFLPLFILSVVFFQVP